LWRLLVFKAQDPNVEWCTKVAAAIQNAIQCYHVNYDERKSTTTQTSLDHFFKRVDRIESNKEGNSGVCSSILAKLIQHKSHYQFLLSLIRKLKTEKENNLIKVTQKICRRLTRAWTYSFLHLSFKPLVTANILRMCPSEYSLDL